MSFKVCKYTGVFKNRMLEVKKATRCHQLYVISYGLIKSYFSNEHPYTFNSFPESRRPHSSKSVRMHHLASLVSKFSKPFQLPKHRFKQRQDAPFSFLDFKIFSAVPTS